MVLLQKCPISFPEAAILLVSTNDHEPLEESGKKKTASLIGRLKRVRYMQIRCKLQEREHVDLILTGHLCKKPILYD